MALRIRILICDASDKFFAIDDSARG